MSIKMLVPIAALFALCLAPLNAAVSARQLPLVSQKIGSPSGGTISQFTSRSPPSSGIHLSHSGLYIASPVSANAPSFVSLYMDTSTYDLSNVSVTATQTKRRTWEDVTLRCGGLSGGSVESCQHDDLKAADELYLDMKDNTDRSCGPASVRNFESRLLFDAQSCGPLDSFLRGTLTVPTKDILESTTFTVKVKQRWSSMYENHHFWLARLHKAPTPQAPNGLALWPFAGTAHAKNDSTSQPWTGLIPNRISGLMQDPYLPKSSRPASGEPLHGVDLAFAQWTNGITIDVPTNPNDSSTGHPEFEPVYAPVTGQVVWTGEYTITRPPSNHKNDEDEFGVMIRDDWGFVHQLLGMNQTANNVKPGQDVRAGDVVGAAWRMPLSLEPPCRHRPADPPKMDDDSRRYPFRRRRLKVRVARPDPTWMTWPGPFESGWQFYNPLDAYERAGRNADIPPDPNPTQIFFARPSEDGGLTPPNVFATSKDLFQPPVLKGNVEVIVGFDDFQQTPGDGADSMDLLALHALDWAIWPEPENEGAARGGDDVHALHTCSVAPDGIVWRTAFEHSKLPNDWAVTLPKTSLLAHYVPTFTTGKVPLFKKTFASVFDEKARKLYYAPTRTHGAAVFGKGGSDEDGAGGAPVAAWDTRREANGGNGLYRFWVRGRNWFGATGCFSAVVRLEN